MAEVDVAHAEFWRLAEAWLARENVEKATMMGFPCLRYDGKFFASIEHKGDGLVVKLPRGRVAECVASGEGEPFAPAGKVFKEWLRVPWSEREHWGARIEEAYAFAGRA